MNKSTLPVAVILAAASVPAQAQDAVANYTKAQLLEECNLAITEVGEYPDAVRSKYVDKLTLLLEEIKALPDDATEEDLKKMADKLDSLKDDAKKEEQAATEDYRRLIAAIDNEKTAKENAQKAIDAIVVPSVKADYQAKFDAIKNYTEEELQGFYNNPEEAKKALDTVNANIKAYNEIAETAAQADEDAKAAQATAKDELLKSISTEKADAEAAKATVEGYMNYDGKGEDVDAIDNAIKAYDGLKTDVETAANDLKLDEKKAEIESSIDTEKKNVNDAKERAEAEAKKAAKTYSENAVNNLPDPFDPIADDDPLKAEKEAVNDAVAAAKAMAAELENIIVAADRKDKEAELDNLIKAANDAQTAYETAVKNLKAYNEAVNHIDKLQAEYDKQNLELQTKKLNGELNDEVYKDANNKMNEVAATINTMKQTNEDNKNAKKYEDGTDDEDYKNLVQTLNAEDIAKIVTDAVAATGGYNALQADLKSYKEKADKIDTDNTFIKDELDAAYKTANNALENYAKGKMSQDDAKKAINDYSSIIDDAEKDVAAYNEATAKLDEIQKKLDVNLPELSDDTTYPDAEIIKTLKEQKTTLQASLDTEKKTIEDSFRKASPRNIQAANEALENFDGTPFETWNAAANTASGNYNKWVVTQSDVVIYNEVMAQVDKLEKKLEGASKGMLGYAKDKKAIDDLKSELAAHGEGHTGCAENYSKWTTEINRISKSIDDHQAAYDANKIAYEKRLAEINDLYDDTYYKAIANKTNKGEANEKIKAAKTLLDQFNRKQTVTVDENVQAVTDAINTAKDFIASNYLQEKGWKVNNSYKSATQIIGSEASELNPSLVYSKKLDGYYKEFKTLDTKYYHNLAKYDEIASEEEALNTLKANIEAVVPDAKANLEAYNKQKNAQTRAKSEWASYYSQVGALYSGEQFFGAQALYQGQLNDCLALINGYDAKIEECYNNGTSVDFGKATDENIGYDASIEENRNTMENVLEDATANKNAYTGQDEGVATLNKSYNEAVKTIDSSIADTEAALESAETDEDKQALTEKLNSLNGYKTELGDIKTQLDNLGTNVLTKVNEGESVAYQDEFDSEKSSISTAIKGIIDKAKGTYDEAVTKHNEIVKANFEAEYKTAKAAYNAAVYEISKYASYQHALDANGVSGYAASIETANETLFPLYEELRGINAEFNTAWGEAEGRFDAEQTYRDKVKAVEAKIADALDTFLKETQQTADANGYATVIRNLAKKYEAIVADIEGYNNEDAMALFKENEGGQVAETTKAYDDMEAVNKGPQVIDELKFKIENGVETNLETAYSDAAKADVNAHISAANTTIAKYQKKLNENYKLSTSLEPAIEEAQEKVENAEAALAASKDVPSDHDNIVAMLSGIDTDLAEAEEKAKVEQAEAEAEKAIQDQFDAYDAQIKLIADGSDETGALGINDYKSPFEYADKLTDLLAAGDAAVEAANDANEKAKKQGYNDTDSPSNIVTGTKEVKAYKHYRTGEIISVDEYNKLKWWQKGSYQEITVSEPIYFNGTAKEYVEKKIAEAQTALDNIKKKVAELEATDAKAIVDGMHDKVQKTLIPLYNRAVANGGNEEELAAVYADINTLLAALDTSELTAEEIEAAASEKNQKAVDAKIESLTKRIAALDNELQAYNSLTDQLDDVKDELEKVKAGIAESEFADELTTAFGSDIASIDGKISETEKGIDADHANNRCGKETAKVKEEDIEAISTSIKALSEEIDEKTKKLQKAKEDAAILAANAEAYDAEKAKLEGLTTTLDSTWETLCKDNVDVWTEFDKTKESIATQIAEALAALEAEKTAADAEPRNISTEAAEQAYTDIDAAIKKMAKDADDRQSAYNAQLTAVQQSINDLATAYDELEISDTAAADAEVTAAQQAMEKAIADLQKKEITPDNIADVETAVAAAEEQLEALKTLIEQKTYIPGDINESGEVNIDDLLLIRNIVLGKKDTTELTENQRKAADLNGDGQFTVADLVMLNNIYVYGNPTGPVVNYTKGKLHLAEPGTLDMQIAAERMDIALNSAMPYAAIQMDVTLPVGVVMKDVTFAGDTQKVLVATNVLDNGACRIVMYSADGSAMLPGAANLLHLRLAGEGNGFVAIDNIIAATSDGTSYSLAAITGNHNISTGISATETEGENEYSVFSTNGVVSKTLKKGVNIVRDAAGRVKKILVK